jgi:ADP-ribose pyrophosphatase YjhB (NUDIX family)
MRFEFSAGGIVAEGTRVLLVRTKNLNGEEVWTFPKGHIEKKEKAAEAALREVIEETGYSCEIINKIGSVEYFFKDKGELIKKTVQWFLMKPLPAGKTREPDSEIDEVKWVEIKQADKLLSYDSDKKTLKNIKPQMHTDGHGKSSK